VFNLPEVPRQKLFVNGPLLARAVPEGVLLRGEETGSAKREGPSPLEETIGPGATFEPLFVYRIDTDDMLLVAWSACIVDGDLPTGATVERRIVDDAGNVVFALDHKPLALTSKGKVRCRGELDSLPGGKLAPGEYRLAILARDAGGAELAERTVPLLVEPANAAR